MIFISKIDYQISLKPKQVSLVKNHLTWVRQALLVASTNRSLEVRICIGLCSPHKEIDANTLQILTSDLERDFEVEVVHFQNDEEYSASHNSLSKTSKADTLILGRPNSLVSPSAIDRLLDSMDEHRNVAMVDSRQIPFEFARDTGFPYPATSWCSGALMAVHRNVFQEVGGFDEISFPMDGSDVDLSWKIRLAGYSIHHVPSSVTYSFDFTSGQEFVMSGTNQLFFSPLTRILLAWKWSNENALDELLESFETKGTQAEFDAKLSFLKMKELDALPKRVDPFNLVGIFKTHNYSLQMAQDVQ